MLYIGFCNIVPLHYTARMELLIFIFKLCFSLLSADVFSKLVSAFLSFTVSLAALQQCNWSPPNQGLYWLHVVRPWLRFRGTRRSVHPLTDVWSPDVTRRPWRTTVKVSRCCGGCRRLRCLQQCLPSPSWTGGRDASKTCEMDKYCSSK